MLLSKSLISPPYRVSGAVAFRKKFKAAVEDIEGKGISFNFA